MEKYVPFLIIVLLIVCLLAAFLLLPGQGDSVISADGTALKKALSAEDQTVVASWNGHVVTRNEILYQKELGGHDVKTSQRTETAITERLLSAFMLLDEAEAAGLAATEQEIRSFVDDVRRSYELPEGKAMIDEYCASAGLTTEEYFSLIRDQAYHTLTLNKREKAFIQEYCEKKGLTYDGVTISQELYDEVMRAYDKHRAALLKQHEDEIEYAK